ncbi:MAG: type II toxin-antitoxin system prevent-host-death family antitoxin [Solirubrobacterales bacterium]|nr:type II toxin-antitoxin system prevent-host-death family antitoxin [Solirubrobacterales bacterium]
MNVSVRELRNHTARVITAVEAGEHVVLTKHGRPVAEIVPRRERVESMPAADFMGMMEGLQEMWHEAGVQGDPGDYELGYTTDDLPAGSESHR